MGIFEEKAYKGVLRSENSECGKNNYEIGRLGKNYSEKSEKTFSIIILHDILNTEMNDMQNRILCVKCSVNGELSLKRKVRLTVYYPHPLQTI